MDVAPQGLREKDDGEVPLRVSARQWSQRHLVRRCYQRPGGEGLATSRTRGAGLHPAVRSDEAGMVRAASDNGVGHPAGKTDQEVEPGLEGTIDRRSQSIMARLVA